MSLEVFEQIVNPVSPELAFLASEWPLIIMMSYTVNPPLDAAL
jgi:hypothetical protein